ncbi:MAG: hypothetical protein ABEH77_02695 [Halobacteriaceae archaeon]
MRVLSTTHGIGLLGLALALVRATVAASGPSSAHPPAHPDHGVNATVYYQLWAGDRDEPAGTGPSATRAADETAEMAAVASMTDLSFRRPPEAVTRWNRQTLREFPAGDRSASVHPPTVALTNGRFIKDAYTAVVAVQPSTRVRGQYRGSNRSHAGPLLVAPNGSVLGTIDYRVAVPADRTSGAQRVNWSLRSHEIETVRLLVDEHVKTTTGGTHTPTVRYSSLAANGSQPRQLTLAADIGVGLRKRITVCSAHGSQGNCTQWSTRTATINETVTVRETVRIVPHTVTIDGRRVQYPDGSLGLQLRANQSWRGYSVAGHTVSSGWRFYAARDRNWDTLVTSTAGNRTTRHSPVHPLQTTAYPAEAGPATEQDADLTLLAATGETVPAPTLPPRIHLTVAPDEYRPTPRLVTRLPPASLGEGDATPTVTAYGLVRGVQIRRSLRTLPTAAVHRSRLSLTPIERGPRTVTVRVSVRDARTGTPINTTGRPGTVVVGDHRVNTSASGTATVTVARASGSVSARYEPAPWWTTDTERAYTEATAVAVVGVTIQPVATLLYRIGVSVGLFLLAVFVLGRVSRAPLWPPWRRL